MKKRYLWAFFLAVSLVVWMTGCSLKSDNSDSANSNDSADTEDTEQTASDVAIGVDVADSDFPMRIQYSDDGRRLVTGAGSRNPYYQISSIKRVDLIFTQSDWWNQMVSNYESETEIPATIVYNGTMLAYNVGVRFKGDTSYRQNNTEKKSFNISLDYESDVQDIDGYESLNFNCAFEDDTFVREIIYEAVNQYYIPAVANNYIDLYINGEYWGIYVNSQQVDSDLIKEWFLSKKGTRWRAEPSSNNVPNFGKGKSALNYLGASASDYEPYYTLKKTYKDDPWSDLIATCAALDNTSSTSSTDIASVLDVDRTLWFLACENVFDDEDSYIHKGGTDYYLYWEVETGRMVPLEYDGNTTMEFAYAFWSPFYNENDSNFPLLYKLLQVRKYRQRYLAHLRTILAERFNSTYMDALIDGHAVLIDSYIQADPKKMMTYAQYTNALTTLKSIIRSRYNYLMSNSEVNVSGLTISDTKWTVDGVEWAQPTSSQTVTVTATISGSQGVDHVYLYGATGVVGNFAALKMSDDGGHGDGLSGDGIYGCIIPAQSKGTRVRFYVEAVASNSAGTRTYDPPGAEHDVYVYTVE
jgi:hypothetical protein